MNPSKRIRRDTVPPFTQLLSSSISEALLSKTPHDSFSKIKNAYSNDFNDLVQTFHHQGFLDSTQVFSEKQFNPYPLLISQNLLQKQERLTQILSKAIEAIVLHFSKDSRISNFIKLPPLIEKLIHDLNDKKKYQIGSWRPDFVWKNNQGEFMICEINARFPSNGYFLSYSCNRAIDKVKYFNSGSFQTFADISNIPEVFVSHFSSCKEVCLFKGEEPGWDIHILQRLLHSKNLVQHSGYLAPQDFSQTVKTKMKDGRSIGLFFDISQKELEMLNEEDLELLTSQQVVCLNDLRTVYIVHDKRFLALLWNNPIMQDYLQPEELAFLQDHVVPSYLPEFADPDVFENSQDWMLKPNLLGKGKGIILGKNCPDFVWKHILQESYYHQNFILQRFLPQPQFSIFHDKSDPPFCSMNVVGTYHCFNQHLLGPGIFRGSTGDIVNVSGGGTILIPVLEQISSVGASPTSAMIANNPPRLHTPSEIFQRCKTHLMYQTILHDCNNFESCPIIDKATLYSLIQKREDSEGSKIWQNAYISPSGATGGRSLYMATDIAENKLQRRLLAEQMKADGLFPSDAVYVNLFSGTSMYRSLEIFNDYCEMSGVTTIPMAFQSSNDKVYEMAKKFHVNGLMGSPTRLMEFAEYLLKNELTLSGIRLILYAAEPLHQSKRQFLEQVFKTQNFHGVYGSAETGVWAYHPGFIWEPEAVALWSLNRYVYNPKMIHLEVSKTSIDANGFGRLIVTNLIRYGLNPLLKYDTGDIGKLETFHYKGKQYSTFVLKGRANDSFIIGNGFFSLESLESVMHKVVDYQIVLSFEESQHLEKITFRVVVKPENWNSAQFLKDLRKDISLAMQQQDSMYILDIVQVEAPALEKAETSQKLKKIVDTR